MSLRRVFLAALTLPLAVGAGCAPATEDGRVQVDMRVSPQPPEVGAAKLEIRLRDEEGRPLAARAVELQGSMTHPGMKPSLATASEAGGGRWRAELDLTMAGDWVVLVEAQLADGRLIRRSLPLPGVKTP